MPQFYKTITSILLNLSAWWLDYVYVIYWQFVGFLKRADPKIYIAAGKQEKPPIILIPGIYERWQFMKPIARALFEAGYSVHVIERLGYNRGDVEAMAQLVQEYAKQKNLKDCIIVAHSKGGLIGKYLLVHYNKAHYFRGMVALNTPFLGSTYARFLPLRSLKLFLPASPLLLTLAANEAVNQHIVSLYGIFDPHIPGGSFLKGAINIQLPVRGHFKVVKETRVHKAILSGIRQLLTK
ncbi:MAG TPA: alpha/beta fold hydrolase [Candidatus Saccharimonadales bacterium]|nr:alpha/beta fold hydrolase [Candidatus Saccharimonadales bacterium]